MPKLPMPELPKRWLHKRRPGYIVTVVEHDVVTDRVTLEVNDDKCTRHRGTVEALRDHYSPV